MTIERNEWAMTLPEEGADELLKQWQELADSVDSHRKKFVALAHPGAVNILEAQCSNSPGKCQRLLATAYLLPDDFASEVAAFDWRYRFQIVGEMVVRERTRFVSVYVFNDPERSVTTVVGDLEQYREHGSRRIAVQTGSHLCFFCAKCKRPALLLVEVLTRQVAREKRLMTVPIDGTGTVLEHGRC